MTFFGYGSIWDPTEHRIVAAFHSGMLSTDDARIIELARLAGFAEEHEPEPAPQPEKPRQPRKRKR